MTSGAGRGGRATLIDASLIAAAKRHPLTVRSLMYHDITDASAFEFSGFSDAHSRLYELELDNFALHLKTIASVAPRPEGNGVSETGFVLTFDDGGVSAFNLVAPLLEELGWRGHFFVATDWIGKTGFLSAAQVRELDRRGHVIGSHSCTHPRRMANISRERLMFEWKASVERLEDIVDHRVSVASVPGGYYSRKVAEVACEAGIDALFNSEPTSTSRVVDGCCVFGRYTIYRWMEPQWSSGFAAGHLVPRLKQLAVWKVKRIAKVMGGNAYLRVQKRLLSAR